MFTRLTRTALSLRDRLRHDDEGATAVEYGLIVGLIAVVLVVVIAALSGALGEMFNGVTAVLETNTPTVP